MLTEQEARTRAERGAAALDNYYPGWEKVIDFDWLDLSTMSRCIIGQLTSSSYISMIRDMGITWNDGEDITYGFDVDEDGDYPVQQEAWVALIRERRGDA